MRCGTWNTPQGNMINVHQIREPIYAVEVDEKQSKNQS